MSETERLTHLDHHGASRMVDVGEKPVTRRVAVAEAVLVMPEAVLDSVLEGSLPKGGVGEVARLAGLQAAKRTADWIPLCHQLPLDRVEIAVEPAPPSELIIRCTAAATARTGVEMEAMVGASAAALAVYDMTKALEKGVTIRSVRLLEKTGGKSGTWRSQ